MIEKFTHDPHHQVGAYQDWALEKYRNGAADRVWTYAAPLYGSRIDHRLLPKGEPSIVIRRMKNEFSEYCDVEMLFSGTSELAEVFAPCPGQEFIALRLMPEQAPALLNIRPDEYSNVGLVPVSAKLRTRYFFLVELAKTAPMEMLAHRLAATFAADFPIYKGDATREHLAAITLRGSNGIIRVGDLARSLDMSERHLRRSLQKVMGLGPKQYARRLRLSFAAELADKAGHLNWAKIAARAGYSDQSHLSSEFRALAGATPSRVARDRRAEAFSLQNADLQKTAKPATRFVVPPSPISGN